MNCPPVVGWRGSYALKNGHEDRRSARPLRATNCLTHRNMIGEMPNLLQRSDFDITGAVAVLRSIGRFFSNNQDGISDASDYQDHRSKVMASIAKLVCDGERNPRKQQMQESSIASRRQQKKALINPKKQATVTKSNSVTIQTAHGMAAYETTNRKTASRRSLRIRSDVLIRRLR
jgi:hypothetical protein